MMAERWEEVLQGSDKDAYREAVEPHMKELLRSARHDLEFYVEHGFLHEDDFTPEEVVGETLLHAWDHRGVRPAQMKLKAWLLGTQYRVMRGLVNGLLSYRRSKSLSLDEPIPDNATAHDTEEWFWDWYQPDREMIWEDVIPAQEPVDTEMPFEEDDREHLLEDTEERHAIVLHDEFEMSLPEVAFTINRTPVAVAEILEKARVGMRARDVEREDIQHPPHHSE